MKRLMSACPAAASAAVIVSSVGGAAGAPACDPDNGGLKLPAGFCATVVATDVGHARHLVVAPNGDVFASIQRGEAVNPGEAAAPPGGLAMGPDGSLYVTEDTKGTIWRVMYKK